MTDDTIEKIVLAVLGAIPPTLVALAAYRQSVKNTDKAEEIGKQVAVVHELANSNLARVSTELQVANAKISGMEKLLTALTDAKNTANVAAALATLPVLPGPAGPIGETGPQGPQGEVGPKGTLFGK